MIVYGDPEYSLRPEKAAQRLAEYFARAHDGTIDSARELLIALGQLEQAVADGASGFSMAEATDRAADYFVRLCAGEAVDANCLAPAHELASTTLRALENHGLLRIKIPEGFAFYCLYPEQYWRATQLWMRARPRTITLVTGIRTIGTTLSAVVKATLQRQRWPVARITIRPAGHPFGRVAEVPGKVPATAIVVDEGPGLSGSSIAATVQALRAAGCADVTVFPSHSGEPGPMASETVRRIWSQTPRIVPNRSGQDRTAALHQKTGELLMSPVVEVSNPAGKSRAPALERTKHLLRSRNGRAVLWKFAGLGPGPNFESLAVKACERQAHLARSGWCLPPLSAAHGFVATEWIDSSAPSPDDGNPARLAEYIAAAAQPPLGRNEAARAFERLKKMTCWNAGEYLGKEAAEAAERLAGQVQIDPASLAYGDGRIGPDKWIFHKGRMFKTDVWGHDWDHTCIGPQPVLWDVAGAVLEWRLTSEKELELLDSLRAHGITVHRPNLDFYLMAYAAFQLGLARMFGASFDRSAFEQQLVQSIGASRQTAEHTSMAFLRQVPEAVR